MVDLKFVDLLRSWQHCSFPIYTWDESTFEDGVGFDGSSIRGWQAFMPKPIFKDNGSGMHTHMSLWKGGEPLFAGDGYAGLSELGFHAIGGLLQHAPAVLAFAAPTSSSYRRQLTTRRGAEAAH
ncbi:MAG: hypothetical protein GEU90_20145 [Gemmatimonas sp.]|nr:hypothetical protein [Gemmatimonas sp.]